jgi:hypothetical protein
MWWESRREGERTAVYLTRVLKELGPLFAHVATAAEALHYDDYFCPPDVDDGFNINRLVRDLLAVQVGNPELKRKVVDVAMAAKSGEFDGTREESREWARSPDGQATFNLLLPGRRGKRNAT